MLLTALTKILMTYLFNSEDLTAESIRDEIVYHFAITHQLGSDEIEGPDGMAICYVSGEEEETYAITVTKVDA